MDAARQKTEKAPAFAVVFDGIPFSFGNAALVEETCLLAGMINPDSGVVFVAADPNPTTGVPIVAADCFNSETSQVKTLKRPSGFGATVTPHQGQSSQSLVQIPIQFSSELQTVVSDFVLRNRRVTITAGFSDVPTDDWVTVFAGLVDNFVQSAGGLQYTFSTVDIQRSQKKQVFEVLDARLLNTGGITNGAPITLELDTVAGFEDIVPGLIRIDDEIMSYDAVDLGLKELSIPAGGRGQVGTTAATHQENAKIREVLRIQGRPVEIALAVMTGSGGSGPTLVTLPDRHNLGISPALIDTLKYQEIAGEFSQDIVFFIQSPEDGKAFLESEVYKPFNLYQTLKGDGRISLKLFEPPLASDDLFEFNNGNVAGVPSINANLTQVFNQVIWKFDFNPGTEEFDTIQYEDDFDSQGLFDRVYPITIESRGLRTILPGEPPFAGATIATTNSGRLFTRYALAPITLSFEGFYETFHVEPGDLVIFNHTLPLNPRTGGRGWVNVVIEITSKSMNFDSGKMRFQALYTPFAGFRYGQYGQDGSDYSVLAGIPASKPIIDKYAFVAGAPIAPDPEGKMANGDDPYRYGG